MWKGMHNRRVICIVMAAALLAGVVNFSEGSVVMAKETQEVKAVNTVSSNQTLKDTEENKKASIEEMDGDEDTEEGTVSGNGVPQKMEADESADEAELPGLTDKENANMMFPSRMEVAFNPLGLAIGIGDGGYSTAQIISSDYEMINKGSAEQIVTVTIRVEDLNGGQIIFVDSPEAVEAAGKDAYAIYLSVVSAKKEGAGTGSDGRTAAPIYEGENQVSFRLPADGGRAAFTFDGVMNSDAEWWELSRGIRISTVYSEVETAADGADISAIEE